MRHVNASNRQASQGTRRRRPDKLMAKNLPPGRAAGVRAYEPLRNGRRLVCRAIEKRHSARVAAAFAAPARAAFVRGGKGDRKRRERVCPPPSEHGVRAEADEKRDREIGAELR